MDKGDARIYSIEKSLTNSQINDQIHRSTVHRYNKWTRTKDEANKIRRKCTYIMEDINDRDGALLDDADWAIHLRSASDRYSTVLQPGDPDSTEYTFLQRILPALTIGSPRDNVKTLLSCIADTCKWSHGTFGKTRVTRHGVSYTVFEAYLDTEELSKIVVCIDFYSTHRAASAQCEPRQIVGSLLAAVEQFWTCTVPSNVREMLQIKYNSVDAALDGVYPVQSIPGTQLRAATLVEGSRPNVRL